jgi:aryl-alcohol dehydrogenase-like predicted oxidoreductase
VQCTAPSAGVVRRIDLSMASPRSRRDFLRASAASATVLSTAAIGASAASCTTTKQVGPPVGVTPPNAVGGGPAASASHAIFVPIVAANGSIPRRPLGKTGVQVSLLAIGGYHLGSVGSDEDATRIVQEALDAGVTFFDNAWEYHDGKSEERLGRGLGGRRKQAFVMTKVCTHGRDAHVAMQQLEDSLKRLGTDYVDLWQIHECIYDDDPELHFAKGGVVEALEQAKKQGKARFVGLTGHKDPSIHLKMLAHPFPFDTVQMPINAFDGTFRSFEAQVMPEALRRGIGVIGMKPLCGDARAVKDGVITAEEALRYSMSQPVSVVVNGIDSLDVLRKSLAIVRGFVPMTDEEAAAMRTRVASYAADGRYELFKTSKKFDGNPGREQHGFPKQDELPT